MSSIQPDETKTTLVSDELADGETVILIAVKREAGEGFSYRVESTTDMDRANLDGGSLIARCATDWQARAVALAVSGSCDCDLDLGPVAQEGK